MVLKEGPYRGKMIFEVPSIYHCWAIENKDKLADEVYTEWLKARETKILNNKKSFSRQLLNIRYREYSEHFDNQPKKQSGSFLSSLIGGDNA